MKTLLNAKWNKAVIFIVIVSMTLTQVMPYGLAQETVPSTQKKADETTALGVSPDAKSSTTLSTKSSVGNPYMEFFDAPVLSVADDTFVVTDSAEESETEQTAVVEKEAAEDQNAEAELTLDAKKGILTLTETEREEVRQVLGVEPASTKITNAMSTSNSQYMTIEYYDADGKLIGSKKVVTHVNPMGETWKEPEITWMNSRGDVVKTNNPLLEEYYNQLRQFDSFMSGIAVQGITLDQIKTLRGIQDALREVIESIIANGEEPSATIMKAFHERVAVLDDAMAKRPLLITIGDRTIEINVSEAMRVIHEEYKLLGLVDTTDLARLPGIKPEDLAGHENFEEYLRSRQPGVETLISLFKGLSPYGNITFLHGLVIRYINEYGDSVLGGDYDNDGKSEINSVVFRRIVNGTEMAYRQAVALMEQIKAAHQVVVPTGAIQSFDQLKSLVDAVETLHQDLRTQLGALGEGLEMEPAFKQKAIDAINQLISSDYQEYSRQISNVLSNQATPIHAIAAAHNITFPTGVTVSFQSILDLAAGVNAQKVDMSGQLDAFLASFTEKTNLVYTVQNLLNGHINKINSKTEYDLLNMLATQKTEINSIVEQHNIVFPSGTPVTLDQVLSIVGQVDALRADMETAVRKLVADVNGLGLGDSLKSKVVDMIQKITNGGWYSINDSQGRYASASLQGVYPGVLRNYNNFINSSQIEFNIDNVGQVLVNANDLSVLTGNLPQNISSLVRFPGLAAVITAEDFAAFEKMQSETLRQSIRFDGSTVPETPDVLSEVGIRFQTLELILNAFGNRIVQDGKVNIDEFRRAILLDENLEKLYAQAKDVIAAAVNRVGELAGNPPQAMTLSLYETLYKLIQDTNGGVSNILKPALDQVIYDARSMVIGMIQNDFNQLVSAVDQITSRGLVTVTIGGHEVTVNARDVMTRIMEIMPRLAIDVGYATQDSYNKYQKEQYARLQGIEASVLSALMSPYEFDFYKSLNFQNRNPNFGRAMTMDMADEEVWYRLVPAVLGNFDIDILDNNDVLLLDKLEDKLLAGVNVPVEKGKTLVGEFIAMVNTMMAKANTMLNDLDYTKWEDRVYAEKLLFEAIGYIQEGAQPFIQDLNYREVNILSGIANYQNYNYQNQYGTTPRFNELWDLLDQKLRETSVQTVTMSDGSVLRVDLNAIAQIPGFPASRNYDKLLFPGIAETDFDGSGNRYRPSIMISKGVVDVPENYDSAVNRDKFIINLLKRHYDGLSEIPALYGEKLFTQNADGTKSLNTEVFRRLIKGVDLLHQDILTQVKTWTTEELAKLEALKVSPMTVDAIRAIYGEVADFHARILEYMNNLTSRHEKEDVIEMEEAVSAVYKQVIDGMINYVRDNQLVTIVGGEQVEIPWTDLTRAMMSVLQEKFPGADIGAHHFASFFGVTIDQLRSFNKLEEFLGMQIIALPRNSQYVEVLSKLSEIGMMELMDQLVHRYAQDGIIEDGKVSVEKLMILISDPVVAMDKAKQTADEVTAETRGLLASLEYPLTSQSLSQMSDAINQMKLNLVNLMNDAITGFSQEMFDEIQAYVSGLYGDIKTYVNEMLAVSPILVTAKDGSQFEIDLSALEGPAVEEIVTLLMDQDQFIEPQPCWDCVQPVYWDEKIIDTVDYMIRADYDIFVQPSYDPIYEPIGPIDRPIYWHPMPGKSDPKDTLTQFGFYQLLVRLSEKYGSFVVDEDGNFSVAKFLKELNRTDAERAQERFQKLQAEAIAVLQNLVPQASGGEITLDQVSAIHSYLDETRNRFLSILNGLLNSDEQNEVINAGNAAWGAVINEYELRVFSKNILIEVDGQTVSIEGQVLANIVREEFQNGYTELVNQYTAGGETQSQYSNFRTLYQQYYYWDYMSKNRSENSYDNPEDLENQDSRYPFNLGQLASLRGITWNDLAGLDVESKDQVKLTIVEAKELLKGLLNMRVFAPGSSVQTIGTSQSSMQLSSASLTADYAVMSESLGVAYKSIDSRAYYPWWRPWRYLDLSQRDLMFRVLPAIVKDYASRIVVDGKVDAEKLRDLLREPQTVKPVKNLVQNDLAASFGFDSAKFAELVKQGLAKIEVDIRSETARVIFDPSVKLEDLLGGGVQLVNPLGLAKLPRVIDYKFEKSPIQMMIACYWGGCGPNIPTYQLNSAAFEVEAGDGSNAGESSLVYNLNYLQEPEVYPDGDVFIKFFENGDNRLHSLTVTARRSTPINCLVAPCPNDGTIVKKIDYKYGDDGSIRAHIVNFPGQIAGGIDQDVSISKLEDGKLHITKVEDIRYGAVIATSEFNYLKGTVGICDASTGGCVLPVALESIVRRDAEGNWLSTAKIDLANNEARIDIGDGNHYIYKYFSLEDLIQYIRNLENENTLETRIRKSVIRELVNSFGMNQLHLEQWLAEGLLKIEVTDRFFGVFARLTFHKSIQGQVYQGSKVNLLGEFKVPATIDFSYPKTKVDEQGNEQMLGKLKLTDVRVEYQFPVKLGEIDGSELVVKVMNVYYDENGRLKNVKLLDGPDFACMGPGCAAPGQVVKEVNYRYYDACRGEMCLMGIWQDSAEVIYPLSQSITRRNITFNSGGVMYMGAPAGAIMSIQEFGYDQNGNKDAYLSNNSFVYSQPWLDLDPELCGPEGCYPRKHKTYLERIVRTNAQGEELSTITVASLNYMFIDGNAQITLPDGTSEVIWYNNYEELLNEAWRFERERISKEIKALVMGDLVDSFGFTSAEIESWLKSGLIKIRQEEPNVMVYFDQSLQGQKRSGGITNPLGDFVIPESIKYTYERKRIVLPVEPIEPIGPIVFDPTAPVDLTEKTLIEESYDVTLVDKVDIISKRLPGRLVLTSAELKYNSPVLDKELLLTWTPIANQNFNLITLNYDEEGRVQKVSYFNEIPSPYPIYCFAAPCPQTIRQLVKEVEIHRYEPHCEGLVCTAVMPSLSASVRYFPPRDGVSRYHVEFNLWQKRAPYRSVISVSEFSRDANDNEQLIATYEFDYGYDFRIIYADTYLTQADLDKNGTLDENDRRLLLDQYDANGDGVVNEADQEYVKSDVNNDGVIDDIDLGIIWRRPIPMPTRLTQIIKRDAQGNEILRIEINPYFMPIPIPFPIFVDPVKTVLQDEDQTDATLNYDSATQILKRGKYAIVRFPNGESQEVWYQDYENLFDIVRRLETSEARLKEQALANLVQTYGFNMIELKAWIAEGLIKFEIQNGKIPELTIAFAEELQGRVHPKSDVDPLGPGFVVPEKMIFTFSREIYGPYPIEPPIYLNETDDQIVTSDPAKTVTDIKLLDSFKISSVLILYGKAGEKLGYDYIKALYGVETWVKHVNQFTFYKGDPFVRCAEGERCLSEVVKTVQIQTPGDTCRGDMCIKLYIYPHKTAIITYANPKDGIAKRVVEFNVRGGMNWREDAPEGGITTVHEYLVDAEGKETLYAKNVYQYGHMAVGMPCEVNKDGTSSCPPAPYELQAITRTDADGAAMSTIHIRAPDMARIELPDGTDKKVEFSDYEKLFAEARQLELEGPQRVRKVVINDLTKTFGVSESVLEKWIKEGLITIEIDLKHLRATVRTSGDLKYNLLNGSAALVDALDLEKLPEVIRYELNRGMVLMVMCVEGSVCIPPSPEYGLRSAEFRVGNLRYDLDYMACEQHGDMTACPVESDNKLDNVKVSIDPICIEGEPCMQGPTFLNKEIHFNWTVEDGKEIVWAAYTNAMVQGGLAVKVKLELMGDHQYHIREIVEVPQGTAPGAAPTVTSVFEYATAGWCVADTGVCGVDVRLVNILRSDEKGPLSKIIKFVNIPEWEVTDAVRGFRATILMEFNGWQKIVEVNYDTIRKLMSEARRVESEAFAEAMRIIDQLAKGIQSAFNGSGVAGDVNMDGVTNQTDKDLVQSGYEEAFWWLPRLSAEVLKTLDFNKDGAVGKADRDTILQKIEDIINPPVEVLFKIKFGTGRVIVEKSRDASGKDILKAKVQIEIWSDKACTKGGCPQEYKTLAEFDIKDYKPINYTNRLSDLLVNTVDGKKITFRASDATYTMEEILPSEIYGGGDVKKVTVVGLIVNQLRNKTESITRTEKYKEGNRWIVATRFAQHTYWTYNSRGELISESTTRTTDDGSSLYIQKSYSSTGVKIFVQVYERGKGVTFKGYLTNVNIQTEKPSGLVLSLTGEISYGKGVVINVLKDRIEVKQWMMQKSASPIAEQKLPPVFKSSAPPVAISPVKQFTPISVSSQSTDSTKKS